MLVVKQKTKKAARHISSSSTHILLKKSLGIYAVLVFALFILLSISAFAVHQYATSRADTERLHRIQAVYQSLNLDNSYRAVRSDVFGDKRTYSWDESRSASSSIEYGHNDTPANTRADLAKKIEAAGFKRIGGAYEGSPSPQDYFKNDKGVYARVSTTSRYVQDSLIYGTFTEGDPLINHKDEAPTYVTLKVNLDDNNE